jgi:hypothetical protein
MLGVVAALAFFTSRDDATTAVPAAQGPGRAAPAATDALLRAGNVTIEAPGAALGAARRLAEEIAGPDSPELRSAGQAVVVRRGSSAEVVARAWRRELRVGSADDPALRDFVEFWLGRGAG